MVVPISTFVRRKTSSESEEVRHQSGAPTDIGGILFSKLRAHPLFLQAEFGPEHDEVEKENDEPAHFGERDREAEESGQNAGVDGVANHGIGAGGDQFVTLLDGDGAAPIAAEVLTRPDGEQKTTNVEERSQPEGPKCRPPERPR